MMGLSYESEPEIRRMQTHFGDVLDIRYAMCVLVDDVRHFMVQEDMAETPEQTLRNYNRRLAGIYRKEEEISGMPIAMEECRLFDMQHLTSEPLCLAVKAVQYVAPDRAEQFLYRLRYATIVEVLPTTHREVLLDVLRQTGGIDEVAFLEAYDNGLAQNALRHDVFPGTQSPSALPAGLYAALWQSSYHHPRYSQLRHFCRSDTSTFKRIHHSYPS